MPELPEVEHQARVLRRWLQGRRIDRAEADPTRLLRGKTTPVSFAERLSGRTVTKIDRRAKYLLLELDDGHCLLSHLGMTGKWIRRFPVDPAPRSSRARLYVSDGSILHNVDTRMFGRLMIVSTATISKLAELRDLGPDPLTDRFDGDVLRTAFGASRAAVKALLMDNSIVAGIGNIQATEALFRAHVHPARPGNSITPAELVALAKGITASIKHTLDVHEQDDEIVYLSERTGVVNPFLAYGRSGEPCPRCRTSFEDVTLGGRTSVYCPKCQRLSPNNATRSVPRRVHG